MSDRHYDSDALRTRVPEQGAWANVKPIPNRKRVPAFDPFLCGYRNSVKRLSGRIEHFHVAALRHDMNPVSFPASVKPAAPKCLAADLSSPPHSS